MAVTTFAHGKNTVVKLGLTDPAGTDISDHVSASNLPMDRDEFDTTMHGSADHTFQGGQRSYTFDLEGKWDATFGSTMQAFVDADEVFLEWGPDGTATGKPRKRASGFITKYEDPSTSTDLIGWKATIRVSGSVTTGAYA